MRVYRYMSSREFLDFCQGIPIKGINQQRKLSSVGKGVCFLMEETKFTVSDGRELIFSPLDCMRFLSGVVSDYVLCEFSTDVVLSKGNGIYSDPTTTDWGDLITIPELYIEEYSDMDFQLERYCISPSYYGDNSWFECYGGGNEDF